jgi:eukaryotic-like serine/threonine-protein kinase
MGDIYRATDSMLGRDVAVKILADRYAQDVAIRERFTREALAAARLSAEHNSVTIYDVGDHNGRPYIVMEYLGGGSLDDVLRSEGAQPPQRVFAWLEQAADALDAAHRQGVVHRDVKPANLMLDEQGNVRVADFGIASAADMESLTLTGTVLGTAGYLAPEQARGERAVPASDRYAFAVVAWELLTGERPFQSESATAEAAAHVSAPVPSISEHSDLPRELDPVFAKALAKEPRERYDTAGDFVAELRAALAEAAGATRALPFAAPVPPVTEPTALVRRSDDGGPAPLRDRPGSGAVWPVFAVVLVLGAIAGALLAYFLTGGSGGDATQGTTVLTRERTVTSPAGVTTVERPVTITTTAPTTTAPAATQPPGSSVSGAALNNAGFIRMRLGDYERALPLLERAVERLQGTGSLDEAYASYNLAYTRFQLGSCDGVLDLLDRSESIQGQRSEIDDLRSQAEDEC